MQVVNYNGNFYPSDAIPLKASNSSLRYGFGLFETILVQNELLQLAPHHWKRLFEGIHKFGFNVPGFFTATLLESEVLKTLKKNSLEKLCRVRLQVFTDMEGVFSQEPKIPSFLIECFPLEEASLGWNDNGWICGVANEVLKANDVYANLKTCNTLTYIIAAQQAKRYKWNDALVLNCRGNIIESSIANVFWIKNEKIYTPPLSEGCISGVMRSHLVEKAGEHNIIVEEHVLNQDTILNADEVFLTNAIRRIKWVKEVDDVMYKNKLTKELYRVLF